MRNKNEKSMKPWHMGTHLIVLIKSFPMHANMGGFIKRFQNFLCSCAFDKSCLCMERAEVGTETQERCCIYICTASASIFRQWTIPVALSSTASNFPPCSSDNLGGPGAKAGLESMGVKLLGRGSFRI